MVCLGALIYLLNWEGPAGDLDAFAFQEVIREEFGVDCGGHEEDLQIRSQRQQISEDEEEEVRLFRSLVNLVHDHVSHA